MKMIKTAIVTVIFLVTFTGWEKTGGFIGIRIDSKIKAGLSTSA